MRNKIIPYNPRLRSLARQLRKNSTLSEILLWAQIKNRKLGVQFHRQVPLENFIVDFYCHELMLAIEIDGSSHDNLHKLKADYERQKILESHGIKFIRISDKEVKYNLDGVTTFIISQISLIEK